MSYPPGSNHALRFPPSDESPCAPFGETATASDQELFHSLTSRDETGFTVFYDRFASVLFSVTYCILQDRKEAEDALQEAFIHMWKQSSTFDPARGRLSSWAIMIARYRALDRLRRLQRGHRKIEASISEAVAVEIEGESGPDTNMMQREERKRVKAALARLSHQQREAVELAFFHAMTHLEISAALKVPLGTVKARIRRGLLSLRDILRSRCEETALHFQLAQPSGSPLFMVIDADAGEIALC